MNLGKFVKLNYLIIPLFTFLVASLGGLITDRGMDWYMSISLPSWTPAGAIIGAVWTVLFILATIAALLVWNKYPRGRIFNQIIVVFLVNGFLNFFWSWLFFGVHQLFLAIVFAVVLGISVLVIIYLAKNKLPVVIWLLTPYAVWVFFASYLTFSVWRLNN